MEMKLTNLTPDKDILLCTVDGCLISPERQEEIIKSKNKDKGDDGKE